MSIKPRKANAGGQIAIEDIVGRDQLVARIWYLLERQSVIMSAERRIGKTTILDLMRFKPPTGWHPVYRDVSKAHSVTDFTDLICEEIQLHLTSRKRRANRLLNWWQSTVGKVQDYLGVKSTKQNWKQALEHAIADLIGEQGDTKLVFLWDEFPQLLDNLCKSDGPLVAMELLDTLRALRKEKSTFRVVLTGSIGLHHVLNRLRDAGYSNEPVNDTYAVEVKPLEADDAIELAKSLLIGEQIATADLENTGKTIAAEGDRYPFYIHNIVTRIKLDGVVATPETVGETVSNQLLDKDDPWKMKHFDDRLDGYYPGRADLARAVLDAVTNANGPIRGAAILDEIKANGHSPTKKELQDLFDLLEKDHYLKAAEAGGYEFKFSLVGRWWKLRERNW